MSSIKDRVSGLDGRLVTAGSTLNHTFEVDVDRIEPDPDQARKSFPETNLRELAASLAEHGQLQPILVRRLEGHRGRWIIVAGERRWRAARVAGIKSLLAIEKSDAHDVASLVENLQRDDLNPIEEALGIKRLSARYGWSQRELAGKLGRSASDINGMLAVARLPENALATVLNSEQPIARNLLIEIARLPDEASRIQFLDEAVHGRLGIMQLRDYVATKSSGSLMGSKNSFDLPRSQTLVPRMTVKKLATVTRSIANMRKDELSKTTLDSLEELRNAISNVLGSG